MGYTLRKAAGRKTAAWLLGAALVAQGGTAVSPGTAEAGAAAAQAKLVRVTPDLTNEVLHNPGMGWVLIDNAIPGHLDAGRTGAYPEVDNVAVLTHWGELEPTEGQFEWSLLDEAIDYWSNLGKRIHFRISTDAMMISGYSYAKSVPEWLFQQYGVPYQERFDQGYTFKLPDYTHPVFMEKLETFLQAFADRYRNDPRLDIVDLRGYGTWGEWHSGHDFDSYSERIATLRTIIDKWDDAWNGDKILALSNSYEWRSEMEPSVSTPASYEDYMSWSAFDYALTKPNLTFRRDGAAGALRRDPRQPCLQAFSRTTPQLTPRSTWRRIYK
ncbi:beta-galactosidase [Cohnella sp. REN36]|uniref:beta-galactosidase n=1 Tax=Cohnella sp. REN36 TaxID=2887347 RepID=UPI001D15238F|nr:beta-galactosidase [Cohnella sp. REN36]MCC3372415.1 beta-galactosidase [Cohnella sp. REN36]